MMGSKPSSVAWGNPHPHGQGGPYAEGRGGGKEGLG